MSIKFSKKFSDAIAEAAAALSAERPKIRLEKVYSGFLVYRENPGREEDRTVEYTFEEVGIDKEGVFWVYMESLSGYRTPPKDDWAPTTLLYCQFESPKQVRSTSEHIPVNIKAILL